MRARQFTRDVIDTLGGRILEVAVPDPTTLTAKELASKIANIVSSQKLTKAQIEQVIQQIEPEAPAVLKGRPSWSMR
jgi:hypothetical protein